MRPLVTYTLPAHWASYLINGDVSSFSLHEDGGDELRQIDQLLVDYGVGHCLSCSDEEFFTKTHDAPLTPACMCLEYTFEEIET